MPEPTINTLPQFVTGGAGMPSTVNIAMSLANSEYSYPLPEGTKRISLKLRDPAVAFKLNVGTNAGQSGATYISIPANASYYEDGLNTKAGATLYFQAATALQVAEIVIWA